MDEVRTVASTSGYTERKVTLLLFGFFPLFSIETTDEYGSDDMVPVVQ